MDQGMDAIENEKHQVFDICFARKLNVNGKDVVIGVWDTAGEEKFESMTRMYYR